MWLPSWYYHQRIEDDVWVVIVSKQCQLCKFTAHTCHVYLCSCTILTHLLTCIALHSFTYLSLVQIDNMADTPFKGAKIIRLKRSNLWDRYKSLLKAQETAVWHARDADQVEGKETMLTVPVEKMIDDVMWMKRVDDEADEWARTHASEVIFVDYEECKAFPESCRTNMLEFLGVESNGQAETG